jgi:serine/threonine protein kinase
VRESSLEMKATLRVPAPDGSPHQVLASGTVLPNGYTLEYLAAGGMGVVYRATKSGRVCIAKEASAGDTRAVIALTQEKALLERLDHPGLPKIYDMFESDGCYYLISEFVDGVTLEEVAATASEAAVRSWALELCDIFGYLHGLRPPVVYRDLKPKNVMLDKSGRLHLIDFGIARSYKEGKERDTELMGSALTASPEHYGGQTDARSDLYTLGATIHSLLARGQIQRSSPFNFPPLRQLNPEVSEGLEVVVARCLQRKPLARYQNVQELRRALLVEEPEPAFSQPPPTVATSALNWQYLVALGCIGLLLGLVIGRMHRISVVPALPPVAAHPVTRETPLETIEIEPTVEPVAVAVPPPEEPAPPPHKVRLVSSPPRRAQLPLPAEIGQLPAPDYPTRAASTPEPPEVSLGNPLEEVRGLVRQKSVVYSPDPFVVGPNNWFLFPVPPDFGLVSGEAPDNLRLRPKGQGHWAVYGIRTLSGRHDIARLVAARRQQSWPGTVISERPPLTLGGHPAFVLQYDIRREKGHRVSQEEIFWSHTNPDWTWVLSVTSGERIFAQRRLEFEALLPSWVP